jgi:hypothetical protein
MQHRCFELTRTLAATTVVLAVGAVILGTAKPGLGQRPAGEPGATAGTTSVDVETFMADPVKLLGSQVTLTGCRAAGFIADSIGCYAQSGRGQTPIDAATFDRASLRQALKHCPDTAPLTACQISVSGLVEKDALQNVHLRNAIAISGDVGTP